MTAIDIQLFFFFLKYFCLLFGSQRWENEKTHSEIFNTSEAHQLPVILFFIDRCQTHAIKDNQTQRTTRLPTANLTVQFGFHHCHSSFSTQLRNFASPTKFCPIMNMSKGVEVGCNRQLPPFFFLFLLFYFCLFFCSHQNVLSWAAGWLALNWHWIGTGLALMLSAVLFGFFECVSTRRGGIGWDLENSEKQQEACAQEELSEGGPLLTVGRAAAGAWHSTATVWQQSTACAVACATRLFFYYFFFILFFLAADFLWGTPSTAHNIYMRYTSLLLFYSTHSFSLLFWPLAFFFPFLSFPFLCLLFIELVY